MKKLFPIILLSFTFLFLFSGIAQASICPGYETSLVPCGQLPNCSCELTDFFVMLKRVFDFAVFAISLPLAGLIIVAGGIMILISGANPAWFEQGKNMIKYSIIALLLIFGSWLIVDVFLRAIGYVLPWSSF